MATEREVCIRITRIERSLVWDRSGGESSSRGDHERRDRVNRYIAIEDKPGRRTPEKKKESGKRVQPFSHGLFLSPDPCLYRWISLSFGLRGFGSLLGGLAADFFGTKPNSAESANVFAIPISRS